MSGKRGRGRQDVPRMPAPRADKVIRPRGGQPGPRGPYKPRESGPTVEQRVRIPLAHSRTIEDRGGKDWLRAVIAKAVAEPQ